jgi:hypothetical protein
MAMALMMIPTASIVRTSVVAITAVIRPSHDYPRRCVHYRGRRIYHRWLTRVINWRGAIHHWRRNHHSRRRKKRERWRERQGDTDRDTCSSWRGYRQTEADCCESE